MSARDLDPDAFMAIFRDEIERSDREKRQEQSAQAAAYRGLPPVAISEIKTEAPKFQKSSSETLPVYTHDPACRCTESELFAIWGFGDPSKVIFVLGHFVTPVPPGQKYIKACLRFAKVEEGSVIPFDTLSATAKRVLAGLADGCYAVQFYGQRKKVKRHGAASDFVGSTEDFKVYKLICDH